MGAVWLWGHAGHFLGREATGDGSKNKKQQQQENKRTQQESVQPGTQKASRASSSLASTRAQRGAVRLRTLSLLEAQRSLAERARAPTPV